VNREIEARNKELLKASWLPGLNGKNRNFIIITGDAPVIALARHTCKGA
jgi:hypothetical protein